MHIKIFIVPLNGEKFFFLDLGIIYIKRSVLENADPWWRNFSKILIFHWDRADLSSKTGPFLKMFKYVNFSMVFATYLHQKSIFLKNFFATDQHFPRRFFWCILCPNQEKKFFRHLTRDRLMVHICQYIFIQLLGVSVHLYATKSIWNVLNIICYKA